MADDVDMFTSACGDVPTRLSAVSSVVCRWNLFHIFKGVFSLALRVLENGCACS